MVAGKRASMKWHVSYLVHGILCLFGWDVGGGALLHSPARIAHPHYATPLSPFTAGRRWPQICLGRPLCCLIWTL